MKFISHPIFFLLHAHDHPKFALDWIWEACIAIVMKNKRDEKSRISYCFLFTSKVSLIAQILFAEAYIPVKHPEFSSVCVVSSFVPISTLYENCSNSLYFLFHE